MAKLIDEGSKLMSGKCPYSGFFWSIFPHSDQKNTEYGHFSGSCDVRNSNFCYNTAYNKSV